MQNLNLGGNNAFDDNGMISLAGTIGNSKVKDIDCSDNPQGFTYESLGPFAQAIQTSEVTRLRLRNVGATDNEIAAMTPYIPGSNLTYLDFSENTGITDQSMYLLFMQGFPNSTCDRR